MRQSEDIAEIAKALAAFQASVPVIEKSATNPFHKSKYAPLEAIAFAIKVPMRENGLSYTQYEEGSQSSGNGQIFVWIKTKIMHVSGQWIIAGDVLMPIIAGPAKNDDAPQSTPQHGAATMTYGRRYSLCAALGVVPDQEDDDGNSASGIVESSSKTNSKAPSRTQGDSKVTPGDWSSLKAAAISAGKVDIYTAAQATTKNWNATQKALADAGMKFE
jgi:ERF superfamily